MPAAPEPTSAIPLHPWSHQQLRPVLGPQARAGRYLAAAGIGAAAWTAQTAAWLSAPLTVAREDMVGAALFVDLVLGVAMLAILPLRRRHPLAVACVTIAASAVSVASLGPAALAVVSMSTWRRRGWVVTAGCVFLLGWVSSELWYRPRFAPAEDGRYVAAGSVLLGLMFLAAAVAAGQYVAARRELLAALHERVLTAEREQILTADVAREAERTRIARETHDVLAHRISLMALHAGALTYRDDLSRAQTTETAGIIQANAQLALSELRQVLGVLRDGPESGHRPPPTLAELPALLADVREAGSDVALDTSGLPGGSALRLPAMPETLSSASFRIVQECLTNAGKHAPGEPVGVRLHGAPGAHLQVEVRNAIAARVDGRHPTPGVGLVGLAERAGQLGGSLEHGEQPGGFFVVRARLPWPA
jgi:signal transduction histidine kinase